MSFEPLKFAYTPPPTVPDQRLEGPVSALSTSSPSGSQVPVATSLASQLDDLIDTSKYLQSVIHSLHPGLGITVDQSHPDLGMALSSIYSGRVPEAVSLKMYDYLLDAELGSLQVNAAAGPDAGVEANSFQHQAFMTVSKSFESQMISDGGVAAQSALLLRSLKAGVIMHARIRDNLLEYPAALSVLPKPALNVIPASGVDIGSNTAGLVQSHADGMGKVYSSMFQVMAQPDATAGDVFNVVTALATCSAVDLLRVNTLLGMAMQSLPLSCGRGLSTGLSSFVLPQAVAQASGVMFQLDRIMQMAVQPLLSASNAVTSAMQSLSGAMSSVGSLVGVIRSMKVPSPTHLSCPLPAMPMNNSAVSGLPIGNPVPPAIANLGFSKGINELSSLMHFSARQASTSNDLHKDSFQRLAARVRGDQIKSTQMLAATSSMGSLRSLVTAFIKEQQSGAAVSTQDATTQLELVGRVLSAAKTGSGSSYVVQNGVVSITPLSIPPVTSGAVSVFAKSGIQRSLTGLQ